jgi:hypothetical protein
LKALLTAKSSSKNSTQPLLDAARAPIADGVDPETRLVMPYIGQNHDALAGKIGELAKLTVLDPEKGLPRFRCWEPAPARRGVPGIDETGEVGTAEPGEA